uniref:Uncharacterized protein n=1 Tax=Meloidogyne incognita TaxID=6306 RepID=A0A914N7Z6_MELIC
MPGISGLVVPQQQQPSTMQSSNERQIYGQNEQQQIGKYINLFKFLNKVNNRLTLVKIP